MMDRRGLTSAEWDELHDALAVMESEAISTMHEFAPKHKKDRP